MASAKRAELDELLDEIPYDEEEEDEDGEGRTLQNLDSASMSLAVGGRGRVGRLLPAVLGDQRAGGGGPV